MRLLPRPYYPTRVLRTDDITLHIVDPRSMKDELLAVSYDLLRPWEHAAGRRAYGQPPPGSPMAQELVEGAALPFVPLAVRVPGERQVQNPQTTSPAHRQAFRDALDWARLERQMLRAVRVA